MGSKSISNCARKKDCLQFVNILILFANFRPVKAIPALLDASPLKRGSCKEVDLVIVRELTGGLYFGEPRKKTNDYALDSLVYTREEIERIVEKAFEIARSTKRETCFSR